MKNFLLSFMLMLTLAGCSTDNTKRENLNPPDWLLGKWEYIQSDFSPTYTFSEHDIVSQVSVVHIESLNERITKAQDEYLDVTVQEIISSEYYMVIVNIAGDMEYYQFNSVDETHIINNGWTYEKIN